MKQTSKLASHQLKHKTANGNFTYRDHNQRKRGKKKLPSLICFVKNKKWILILASPIFSFRHT